METAANANRSEWEAQLKAKLDEWKEMKAAGILDKLGDEPDEDIIVEMDSMSKRMMRKQRGISKEKEAANKAIAASLRLAGEEVQEASPGILSTFVLEMVLLFSLLLPLLLLIVMMLR